MAVGGGGHRATRAAIRNYKRDRAVQTKFPEKPTASVMAAPRRAVVWLTRIESQGWRGIAESEPHREECPIIAHFSDGNTHATHAVVTYKRGEREALFEAMADVNKATDEIVAVAQALVQRRQKAVADVYREIQRTYAKPFVRCHKKRHDEAAA